MRLGFVLAYPQLPVVDDALGYDQEAREFVVGGQGWFAKGPIYPMFLASVYGIFGQRHSMVRIFQAMISIAVVLLVYVVAEDIFGRHAAMRAALLASVYPAFISYSGLLLAENLTTFLLLAFVWTFVRAVDGRRYAHWVGAAVLGGVTVLLREEMAGVVILASAVTWRWRNTGISRMVVFFATMALVIAPWTVRNYVVFQRFVLVSPQTGGTLWISTNDREGPEWDPRDAEYQALVAGLGPAEADRKLRDEALRKIVTRPLAYLKLCLKRIPQFWLGGHSNTFVSLEDRLGAYMARQEYGRAALKAAMLALNTAVIVAGFIGMWLAWRFRLADAARTWLLALPVFVKAVIHFFLFATLRYQVPIMSFLIIFAACAVCFAGRARPAERGVTA